MLCEKVKVIEEHEKKKCTPKDLMTKFKVGKTQIYDILKNKDKIMDEWLKGTNSRVIRVGKITGNEEINETVWEWFVSARAKGMPISGPIIQAEAMEVAKRLNNINFKASNGWLESFRKRHNIIFNKVCGEANDVNVATVNEWKDKLKTITDGYDIKDIFNGDETGLFSRLLPAKTLAVKGDKCIGGKTSKERGNI